MVVAGIAVAEGIADDAGIGVRLVDLEGVAGMLVADGDVQGCVGYDIGGGREYGGSRTAGTAEVVAGASVLCSEEAGAAVLLLLLLLLLAERLSWLVCGGGANIGPCLGCCGCDGP